MSQDHDVFIEAGVDNAGSVWMAVECACGVTLKDVDDTQLSLDDAVDLAWTHRE